MHSVFFAVGITYLFAFLTNTPDGSNLMLIAINNDPTKFRANPNPDSII